MQTSKSDPYLAPSFPVGNRLMRLAWGIVYTVLFRPSPRTCHAWRSFLLRCFGAKMGRSCHIYPGAKIWAPWNLFCGYQATVADGATVYNPKPVRLGTHTIISQEAYLCGATHDYEDPEFPLVARIWTARQNVNYNAALDLMKQPPTGIRIRVFRPLRPLPVGSFTVEPKQIAAALALGHDEALQQMANTDAEPSGDSVSG